MQNADRIDALIARQSALWPDATAIIDPDGAVSFAQYDRNIAAAGALLAQSGVMAGDRVLIVAENCLATAVFIFAASRVGAIAVPVNARMTAPEIARVTDHAQPRVVIYTSGCSAEALAHATSAVSHDIGFGPLHLMQRDTGPAEAEVGDVAVILYTTGTTGAPKGVMLTHANLIFAGGLSVQLRSMTAQDRIYGVLPLTHVFGLASVLIACALSGAALQLETRFSPARLHAALTGGVTVFPGVPQMHALLMQYAADRGLTRLTDSVLRYVSSGAAPLDPAWKAKAEAFYGLPLQNGYGMTESTAGVSGSRNAIGDPDTSAGRPLPGVDVRIDAPAGVQVGEVLTRGPHVMKGYYRAPDLTAQTVQDGWLRTGDLGQLDAAGNLHIVGRAKELIIRGGFNVYPPEVETALNDHAEVIQSAVIGAANSVGDEDILAFVQCRDPATFDTAALAHFVAGRLSGYKRPTRIFAVDALPAAPTGKILKHKLLDAFADLLMKEG
ncbi:long-chain fatty acid--CoA ligase [Loktanella sp. 3ANDIMAR09]|uniref:class I adenylate-forming enzyme family protein n=1 Tax=Loktanella sp. 3ANDIMAR09 TaxID=1225657 RepID=UPI0006F68154|nr:AMP-binding protein [Loktanella sp. 3ANDIMAR09]KQI68826.1 long-chain fatty acid--CoA ligase [Loktanella sp. 3ANDIMAR09]